MPPLSCLATVVALFVVGSSGLEREPHHAHHRSRRLIGGRSIWRPRPWMVGIINPDEDTFVWCGGSLIHPQWVMTAASCMSGSSVGFKAMVGGVYLPNSGFGSEKQYANRTVTKIYPHPDFQDGLFSGSKIYEPNNIALLRLDAPVNTEGSLMRLNTFHVPALSSNETASQTVFELFGWGAMYRFEEQVTNDAGDIVFEPQTQYPQQMRQTYFPLMAKPWCAELFEKDLYHGHTLSHSQFCAGGMDKQGCYTDEGGALFNEGSDKKGDKVVDRPCQAGVYADSDRCIVGDNPQLRPGMYTDVSFYVPWIKAVIASVDGEYTAKGVGTCTMAVNNSAYKKRYWRSKTKPIDGPEASPLPKL